MASRFVRYIQDTRREMAHVSWPTRAQTIAFTVIVIVISLFVAAYLSAFDAVFSQALRYTLDNAPRFTNSAPASSSTGTSTPNVNVQVASTSSSGSVSTSPIELSPVTGTTSNSQ